MQASLSLSVIEILWDVAKKSFYAVVRELTHLYMM